MLNSDQLTIWRLTWSHATGVYWLAMRLCQKDDAESWLSIFRKDESGVTFQASRKKPALPEDARELARHVAMFR